MAERPVVLRFVAVVLVVAAYDLWVLGHNSFNSVARQTQVAPTAATFAGADACASCHPLETGRWRTSMHARAMQKPSRESVAAPFAGERFSLHGVTSSFSQRAGRFLVRTDGPDGVVRDFDVAYTFGVYPLQQYLIAQPGGRLQTLGISWDDRPAPDGQRWFHLYPERPLRAGDVQHWTNRSQNWNFMCADCHSTNVRKGYRADTDAFETSWSELNVACEACHGPGSRHIEWAERARRENARPATDEGLMPVRMRPANEEPTWTMDPATGIAHRNPPRTSHVEVEMCARCHSRRSQLTDEVDAARPLADAYLPVLLDEDLYFPDGQIKGEVYEYGSFLQSRMYANGVTCSDCHEPHKPELTSTPDDTCGRCHAATKFATPAHHHHADGSAGGSCVACHMPARTYMTIDQRRDHSFRIPRPDLTTKIGVPNACSSCHAKQPASWAAARMKQWFGPSATSRRHYGEAIAAARAAAPDAQSKLLSVVNDGAMPAIARATAVSLLGRWIDSESAPAVQQARHDPDPLVRMAAVDALRTLPEPQRALLTPLLADPIRAVRIEAARALATLGGIVLGNTDRARLAAGLADWQSVQRFNADTAAAHVNLGSLHAERREFELAKQEYETALKLEPYFAPAAANLADLYRAQGRDDAGERVLREALHKTPDVSMLHYALGLLLVRQRDMPAAIAELRRAAALEPGNPQMQSTLALALANGLPH